MREHILRTRVVSCLTLVFFLSSIFTFRPVFALEDSPPNGTLSKESPSDLSLMKVPPEMGKIEDFSKGAAAGVVVLIQDAHEIPDAQKNIQRLIDHFQKNYGVNLIGLEGANARLDARIFKSFPDKERLKKVFKEYQAQGELAAGTGSAIFGRSGDYEGVEDWSLYEEGIGFYLQAMREEPRVFGKLKVLENNLQAEKEKLYSPELLEVDRTLENFYSNQGALLETLRKLAAVKPPSEGSELALLLKESETQSGEEALEREVKTIARKIESFLQTQNTTDEGKKKLAEFSARYQDFQTSRVTPKAFAVFLKKLTAGDRLPFRISKVLSGSMREQKRMEQIKGTKFFEDYERYADGVKDSLMQNEDQRRLGRESRELRIVERLAKLELTREDWEEIKEKSQVTSHKAQVKRQKNDPELFGDDMLTNSFQPHLAFYRNAEKRDAAMFENLIRLMGGKSAILVAGGFHTEGLTRRLQEKGISYLRLMPNIESIPEETNYRAHMRGEVSWKKYLKPEGNKINLYNAFVRGTRDKLLGIEGAPDISHQSPGNTKTLEEQNAGNLLTLKSWRDQIILDLANQNKIEKAGEYTKFIDELSEDGKKEKLKAEWMANIDRFLEGLSGLKSRNELNRENILNLLKPSNAPAWTTPPGVLVSEGEEVPSSFGLRFGVPSEIPAKELSVTAQVRSEARMSVNQILQAYTQGQGKRTSLAASSAPRFDYHQFDRYGGKISQVPLSLTHLDSQNSPTLYEVPEAGTLIAHALKKNEAIVTEELITCVGVALQVTTKSGETIYMTGHLQAIRSSGNDFSRDSKLFLQKLNALAPDIQGIKGTFYYAGIDREKKEEVAFEEQLKGFQEDLRQFLRTKNPSAELLGTEISAEKRWSTALIVTDEGVSVSHGYEKGAQEKNISLKWDNITTPLGENLPVLIDARSETRLQEIAKNFSTFTHTVLISILDLAFLQAGLDAMGRLIMDVVAGFWHLFGQGVVMPPKKTPANVNEGAPFEKLKTASTPARSEARAAGERPAPALGPYQQVRSEIRTQNAKPEDVRKSPSAFDYEDASQDFSGVDLEHFVHAQNRLAEKLLTAEQLRQVLASLNLSESGQLQKNYDQIYGALADGRYDAQAINQINGGAPAQGFFLSLILKLTGIILKLNWLPSSLTAWIQEMRNSLIPPGTSYEDPRLAIEIIGQNPNPRAQGINEAVANSLDALGFNIGQFGKGVKQIIDWLGPTGHDRIDVFTAKGGTAHQLTLLRSENGQSYIQIRKIEMEKFKAESGGNNGGTVVRVTVQEKIPRTDRDLTDQSRNSQEGIAEGIHKRVPFITPVEITTQTANDEAPVEVNGFENKKVVIPVGKSPQQKRGEGKISVKITDSNITMIDNGRGMDASALSRMFVPKQGSKHPEPLGGDAAKKELQKVEIVHDKTMKRRISFSRNGEVIRAVDVPADIAGEATAGGGLMIEFGSLLDVPESRDNIILSENFQLAVEYAVTEILKLPASDYSDEEKLRYINTLAVGLDGLFQGNEIYGQRIHAIQVFMKKALAEIIQRLENQGYALLPHPQEFKKLALPKDKKGFLYVHPELFPWQGAYSLIQMGAKRVPGITLDGDKRIPLVVAPFNSEAVKHVTLFDRLWHNRKDNERLPIIATDRFVMVSEELGKRIYELADKRNKPGGLSQEEEEEFKSLVQRINIITAKEVTTSYEVTEAKKNLQLSENPVFKKDEGKIDSKFANEFLAKPPVPAAEVPVELAQGRQNYVLLENGKVIEVGTGRVVEENFTSLEYLGRGYYHGGTSSADRRNVIYHFATGTRYIVPLGTTYQISPDKRFVFIGFEHKVLDLETGEVRYLLNQFSTIPHPSDKDVNPIQDFQFSADGKYFTYLEKAKDKLSLHVVDLQAKKVIQAANFGGKDYEYALNPFANVAFVRSKADGLLALLELTKEDVTMATPQYRSLHTDSTGTYTVAAAKNGEMKIYLHKSKKWLTAENFERKKIFGTYTQWKNGRPAFFAYIDNEDMGTEFTADGEIFHASLDERPDYTEEYSATTGIRIFKGEAGEQLIASANLNALDPIQRLDKPGIYKHPHFELFIDNRDIKNPIAIDPKTGKKTPFQEKSTHLKEPVFVPAKPAAPDFLSEAKPADAPAWLMPVSGENLSFIIDVEKNLEIFGQPGSFTRVNENTFIMDQSEGENNIRIIRFPKGKFQPDRQFFSGKIVSFNQNAVVIEKPDGTQFLFDLNRWKIEYAENEMDIRFLRSGKYAIMNGGFLNLETGVFGELVNDIAGASEYLVHPHADGIIFKRKGKYSLFSLEHGKMLVEGADHIDIVSDAIAVAVRGDKVEMVDLRDGQVIQSEPVIMIPDSKNEVYITYKPDEKIIKNRSDEKISLPYADTDAGKITKISGGAVLSRSFAGDLYLRNIETGKEVNVPDFVDQEWLPMPEGKVWYRKSKDGRSGEIIFTEAIGTSRTRGAGIEVGRLTQNGQYLMGYAGTSSLDFFGLHLFNAKGERLDLKGKIPEGYEPVESNGNYFVFAHKDDPKKVLFLDPEKAFASLPPGAQTEKAPKPSKTAALPSYLSDSKPADAPAQTMISSTGTSTRINDHVFLQVDNSHIAIEYYEGEKRVEQKFFTGKVVSFNEKYVVIDTLKGERQIVFVRIKQFISVPGKGDEDIHLTRSGQFAVYKNQNGELMYSKDGATHHFHTVGKYGEYYVHPNADAVIVKNNGKYQLFDLKLGVWVVDEDVDHVDVDPSGLFAVEVRAGNVFLINLITDEQLDDSSVKIGHEGGYVYVQFKGDKESRLFDSSTGEIVMPPFGRPIPRFWTQFYTTPGRSGMNVIDTEQGGKTILPRLFSDGPMLFSGSTILQREGGLLALHNLETKRAAFIRGELSEWQSLPGGKVWYQKNKRGEIDKAVFSDVIGTDREFLSLDLGGMIDRTGEYILGFSMDAGAFYLVNAKGDKLDLSKDPALKGYKPVDVNGKYFVFAHSDDPTKFLYLDPEKAFNEFALAAIFKEEKPPQEDEKAKAVLEFWNKEVVSRRDAMIAQVRAAFKDFLDQIPGEYGEDIQGTLKPLIGQLYDEQEKEIRKAYQQALDRAPPDPRQKHSGMTETNLPFDIFETRMAKIIQRLPEYLQSPEFRLPSSFEEQRRFYEELFTGLFGLAADKELEIDSSILNQKLFELLGLGWKIGGRDGGIREKLDAVPLMSRFMESLRQAQEHADMEDLAVLVSFLSRHMDKNPSVVTGQLEKILNAKPKARNTFLKEMIKAVAAMDEAAEKALGEYFRSPEQSEGLGNLRPYVVFLTHKVEQLRKKDRFVPEGKNARMPEGDVEISQIMKLQQQLSKKGESKLISVEELIDRLFNLPKRSEAWEAATLQNTKVQRESGAYTGEIAQNSIDATRGKQGELVVDFYLQEGPLGEEYVEEATDNGTGALQEIALLIDKSTKAQGQQIDLTGFFGTGKYTMFEGVDRVEIITRNADRAYMFTFEVIKENGNAVAIKLTGIRRIDMKDERVKEGVTVRRVKKAENTIPELDQMLAARSWKIFAGMAQNDNFKISLVDHEDVRQPLKVENKILSETDFKVGERALSKMRIYSTQDMPLQIIDKAGLRVSNLKQEYLALIPVSLHKHFSELGIILQIPLPLIRNRSAFEHENEYLPVIQKYVAIEFFKALAYKTLSQTRPQFVFENFPMDWETNDSYWSSIDFKDNALVGLAQKINEGRLNDIRENELENLLPKSGQLDKEKKFLKLMLLLEVALDSKAPGEKTSLLLRRLVVQAKVNAERAKSQTRLFETMGYTPGRLPSESEIPDYAAKVRQAQSIEASHEQMRHPEKYIVPPEKYTPQDHKLAKLAESIVRHFGIEQIVLMNDRVRFAGAFKTYNEKKTMFLGEFLAKQIGQAEPGSPFVDKATDTIVHELAHLLEELIRRDEASVMSEGYISHLSNFTHDAVGIFAEAMKYVAAVALVNHPPAPSGQSPNAPGTPPSLDGHRSEARTVDFDNAQEELGETAGILFKTDLTAFKRNKILKSDYTLDAEAFGGAGENLVDLLGQAALPADPIIAIRGALAYAHSGGKVLLQHVSDFDIVVYLNANDFKAFDLEKSSEDKMMNRLADLMSAQRLDVRRESVRQHPRLYLYNKKQAYAHYLSIDILPMTELVGENLFYHFNPSTQYFGSQQALEEFGYFVKPLLEDNGLTQMMKQYGSIYDEAARLYQGAMLTPTEGNVKSLKRFAQLAYWLGREEAKLLLLNAHLQILNDLGRDGSNPGVQEKVRAKILEMKSLTEALSPRGRNNPGGMSEADLLAALEKFLQSSVPVRSEVRGQGLREAGEAQVMRVLNAFSRKTPPAERQQIISEFVADAGDPRSGLVPLLGAKLLERQTGNNGQRTLYSGKLEGALRVLGEIGTGEAAEALAAFLQDGVQNEKLRLDAIFELNRILVLALNDAEAGDKEMKAAMNLIEGMLKSQSPQIKKAAVAVLRLAGSSQKGPAIEILTDLTASDPDEGVVKASREALAKLGVSSEKQIRENKLQAFPGPNFTKLAPTPAARSEVRTVSRRGDTGKGLPGKMVSALTGLLAPAEVRSKLRFEEMDAAIMTEDLIKVEVPLSDVAKALKEEVERLLPIVLENRKAVEAAGKASAVTPEQAKAWITHWMVKLAALSDKKYSLVVYLKKNAGPTHIKNTGEALSRFQDQIEGVFIVSDERVSTQDMTRLLQGNELFVSALKNLDLIKSTLFSNQPGVPVIMSDDVKVQKVDDNPLALGIGLAGADENEDDPLLGLAASVLEVASSLSVLNELDQNHLQAEDLKRSEIRAESVKAALIRELLDGYTAGAVFTFKEGHLSINPGALGKMMAEYRATAKAKVSA